MSASNVNVVSNIYIRNPDSISGTRDNLNKDPVFVACRALNAVMPLKVIRYTVRF